MKLITDSYRDWNRNLNVTIWSVEPQKKVYEQSQLADSFEEPSFDYVASVGQELKIFGHVRRNQKRTEDYVTDTVKAPITYTVGSIRE